MHSLEAEGTRERVSWLGRPGAYEDAMRDKGWLKTGLGERNMLCGKRSSATLVEMGIKASQV